VLLMRTTLLVSKSYAHPPDRADSLGWLEETCLPHGKVPARKHAALHSCAAPILTEYQTSPERSATFGSCSDMNIMVKNTHGEVDEARTRHARGRACRTRPAKFQSYVIQVCWQPFEKGKIRIARIPLTMILPTSLILVKISGSSQSYTNG
jgi:hypothetical protein